MTRAAILSLLAALAAAPVIAQEAEVDGAAVRACFEATGAGEGAPGCAGGAADACQARPGGETTIGISECLMAETQVWEALMAEALDRQAGVLGAEGDGMLAGQLHETQRHWKAYRDAECGLRYGIWIGGTIRSIVAADCQLQKTAARAVELEHLGGME